MKMTGSSSNDWIYQHFGYGAITDLHILQFTVVHALGFSVFTSHLLATDFKTEIITSNHYEVFLSSTNFLWLSPPENSELTDCIHFSHKHSAHCLLHQSLSLV
jgi:hypothetical protein